MFIIAHYFPKMYLLLLILFTVKDYGQINIFNKCVISLTKNHSE